MRLEPESVAFHTAKMSRHKQHLFAIFRQFLIVCPLTYLLYQAVLIFPNLRTRLLLHLNVTSDTEICQNITDTMLLGTGKIQDSIRHSCTYIVKYHFL